MINPGSVNRSTFFLLLYIPAMICAQTYDVSGTIKDSEGEVLPFANVFLLYTADSTTYKGASADERGAFTITGVDAGLYLLTAAFFGYSSTPVPLDISGDVRIGALLMDQGAEQLEEVLLTARRPTIERQADRVVFNVENTVVSQGNSWDIVRNTPGVISIQGSLEIRGQAATLYMNDRKLHLSQSEIQDLLEGLSGNSIKAIEVIPNPPARYEAEGGPIVNIVTTRNIVPGYKGSVQGNYTQAVFPKFSAGTSHYYKTDKLNIFGNYTINPRKEFKEDESTINFINTVGDIFSRWDTRLHKVTRSLAQQASAIVDYDFDERNSINFTTNLSFSPNRTFDNLVNTRMRNAAFQLDSTLTTVSELENDNTNLAFDLTYDFRPKKEGTLFKANMHYTYFDELQQQSGSSDYFNPAGGFMRNYSFYTDALQDIDILTGQLDYFTAFGSANFETGAKFSSIRSGSGIDYFDVSGSVRTLNPALSDAFEYDEAVYAAYISLIKNWERWSLKVGLRAEQTDVEGRSLSLGETNTQTYFELFPSAYILHTFSEEHSFSLDYSRKLRRPDYQDLNPFRYFLNENDFNQGNPELQPNFSHNLNLNYSFKDTYFIDLYYRDNGAYISTLSFQDNDELTLRQVKQNVLESISYGLDFTIGKSLLNWWYLYAYTSLFAEEETFLALESESESATNRVTGVYGFFGNYLTLSSDGSFTGEVSLTYLSGFLDGSYKLSEATTLNLGLRKSFWDNRAVLSVGGEDILGLANARYTSRYLNQDNAFIARPETRFFRLGLTYNFGNFRLADNQRNLDKNERERLKRE